MKTLPPIPKFVDLATGRVTVLRETPSEEDSTAVGTFRWVERTARIDPKCNLTAAWHVLEHELVHAILIDAGVELKKNKLELVCNAIAAARVSAMLHPV